METKKHSLEIFKRWEKERTLEVLGIIQSDINEFKDDYVTKFWLNAYFTELIKQIKNSH